MLKWDNKYGVVDKDTGNLLLQIVCVNASKKYRQTAGKELVNKLNSIEEERCKYCDGTGDVHRADGEWLGECKECLEPGALK